MTTRLREIRARLDAAYRDGQAHMTHAPADLAALLSALDVAVEAIEKARIWLKGYGEVATLEDALKRIDEVLGGK